MSKRRRVFLPLAAGALLAALLTSGCVSSTVASRMIEAPNRRPLPRAMAWLPEFQQAMDRDWFSLATRVRIEPDATELSVAVLEPGDYTLKHEFKIVAKEKDKNVASFSMSWKPRTPYPDPPKGTIVVLHGIMMSKDSMLHWAFYLAQENYRVVLVDLRGHGRSTGKLITYGARECRDLSQVLDELTRRDLVAGRVGVIGLSYGAAMAIQWAAIDPRIASVVALAPYSDPRAAIGEFGRAVMPKLTSMVSPDAMTRAFSTAAGRAKFKWDDIDVVAATRRLRSPVLLFHGRHDTWIPPYHSERIKDAAPPGSELILRQDDHMTLSLRLQPMARRVSTWFARALGEPSGVPAGAESF